MQAIDRRFEPYYLEIPGASGSPAAGKIAFVSSRDGNPEIYTINTDGTELTRLTNDPAVDEEPAWSPDGRIAFVSERSGNSIRRRSGGRKQPEAEMTIPILFLEP